MLRKSKVPLTWLGTALIVASVSVAGCYKGGQDTDVPPSQGDTCETHTVTLQGIAFNPASLTIKPCDTVRWQHADGGIPHTVTSGSHGAGDAGSLFDSAGPSGNDRLRNGDTFSHTFSSAGSFPYHCRVHGAGMTGTITVSN